MAASSDDGHASAKGLQGFVELNLSEIPSPPSGEGLEFFVDHDAAIAASAGAPLDAAQQQQLDEEDARSARLVAWLEAHLGKLPEALREAVRHRWIDNSTRLSGIDQIVAADADDHLVASLARLIEGDAPPAQQQIITGLIRLSGDDEPRLRRMGADNTLAEEERWPAAEPQLGARPLLRCLLRRVSAEDVIAAATRTDLTLLYSMLGVRLPPYGGQTRKRKRPTPFPRGRVREERDDVNRLLKLLRQMRLAGQSSFADKILRSATAGAGREARHDLLPGTTTRSAACAVAACGGPLTLGWAPFRIATTRLWLIEDVKFDAAFVNGASVDALEGFLVMVLEAEGGQTNMRLPVTGVLRALGAAVASPLIESALSKIDDEESPAEAATAIELALRAVVAFDGSSAAFCRWASRRFAVRPQAGLDGCTYAVPLSDRLCALATGVSQGRGASHAFWRWRLDKECNVSPRHNIEKHTTSLRVDAMLVLAGLRAIEDEEEQAALVATILEEAVAHCEWVLPSVLATTAGTQTVTTAFKDLLLRWAKGKPILLAPPGGA